MKRHWLRGVLLGVSLALLLAGGVALAQGLTITPGKECFTCAEGEPEFTVAELAPENTVEFDVGGRSEAGEYLCFNFYLDGAYQDSYSHLNEEYFYMWAYCDEYVIFWDHVEDYSDGDASPSDVWMPFGYGEWTVEVCPGMCASPNASPAQDDCAETTVLLAEFCEEAVEEFVPEPGSLMLLGGGLMGLAGYATLRWRTKR